MHDGKTMLMCHGILPLRQHRPRLDVLRNASSELETNQNQKFPFRVPWFNSSIVYRANGRYLLLLYEMLLECNKNSIKIASFISLIFHNKVNHGLQ